MFVFPLCCALAGSSFGAPRVAAASAIELVDEQHEEIARILAGPHEPGERLDALVRLGPAAVPACFDLLTRRVQLRSESGVPLFDAAALDPLHEAFEAWDRVAVTEGVIAAIGGQPSYNEMLLAAELIGRFGQGDAFEVLLGLAGELQAELRRPSVRSRVEPALTSFLRRDSSAFGKLEKERDELDHNLLEACVRAAGAVGDRHAVSFLRGLMNQDSRFDEVALEALGEPRTWDQAFDLEACGELVKRHLSAVQPKVRRQAAVTLGRLRYADAIPELLELLDDHDDRVCRGALWALQNVTGLGWSGADIERWEAWYEDELTWLEIESPAVLDSLRNNHLGHSMEALRVIGSHPVFRAELAPEVALLLPAQNEALALAACATLIRLDAPSSVAPLIDALADGREKVRHAASGALSALTGASVGPSLAEWRNWLEG